MGARWPFNHAVSDTACMSAIDRRFHVVITVYPCACGHAAGDRMWGRVLRTITSANAITDAPGGINADHYSNRRLDSGE